MKFKKKLLIAIGVVVAVAVISGVSILAATNLGTSSDPLVTLSYLTNKLKPQLMTEVQSAITAAETSLKAALDAKIDSFEADIEGKLSGSGSGSGGDVDTFTVVTLSKNQVVTCGIGAEIMLRVGTATAAGSNPALVDSTAGSTVSAGGALTTNHMYLVTIQGNGLKATAATVKILIRGDYTVS
jgi:hypothetical protein